MKHVIASIMVVLVSRSQGKGAGRFRIDARAVRSFTTKKIIELGEARQFEQALEIFQRMAAKHVEPDAKAWNALIDACAKGKRPEKAADLVNSMTKKRLVPDAATYQALISASESGANHSQTLETFQAMQRQGLVLDAVAYTSYIEACEKCERPKQALEVFKQMQECDESPTANAYASVIKTCGKCGQSEQALEIFRVMQSNRAVPDVIVYKAILSACETAKQPDQALEILSTMTDEQKLLIRTSESGGSDSTQPETVDLEEMVRKHRLQSDTESDEEWRQSDDEELIASIGNFLPHGPNLGAILLGIWAGALLSMAMVASVPCRRCHCTLAAAEVTAEAAFSC